jgi:hypothetical protein
MNKGATIFNDIRNTVSEHGGSPALADELCTRVGDEIEDAVGERFSQQFREDDPPPRRLGWTELEAAMRWCPHAREHTPVGKGTKDVAIGNRYLDQNGQDDYTNPAGARCIGSMCMSWRWHDALRGYCGLAGEPRFQPLGEPPRLPNRHPLQRPSESLARELFDE